MSSALAVVEGHAPATVQEFDQKRVELIRQQLANGAPQLEFDFFIALCRRTGLSPEAKQIYLIKRGEKWTPQTSIDGYRLIADRSHVYAGGDRPVFEESGQLTQSGGKLRPDVAVVTVWKLVQGVRCAFTAEARWDEYAATDKAGKPTGQWSAMPYLMLAKCAEALALRRAFPAELSGLYTDAEMDQAGRDVVEAPAVIVAESRTPDERRKAALRRLHAIMTRRKRTHTDIHALAFSRFGLGSVSHLSEEHIAQLVADLDPDLRGAMDDEALAEEIRLAYEKIEAEKARQAPEAASSESREPAEEPLDHWSGLWAFCAANGIEATRRRDLEDWLGEPIRDLTPQQAKELVASRLVERTRLDAEVQAYEPA